MKKILIVEDEVLIAMDLEQFLVKLGYTVVDIIHNSDHVFGAIEKQNPDLILLDINIKGSKNGIELGNLINEQHQIPFIYVTSYSDPRTIAEVKSTNPSGIVMKPFDTEQLQLELEKAVKDINDKA